MISTYTFGIGMDYLVISKGGRFFLMTFPHDDIPEYEQFE